MSRPSTRAVLRVALPLLLGLVGACATDFDTPQEQALGQYNLTLVNGDSLPYQTGELDGFIWEVMSGQIIANADQTCAFRHTYRATSLADQSVRTESDDESCTWQLIDQGFHVRFPSTGGLLSGLLAQNALWFDFPGTDLTTLRFMYQRSGSPPAQ
jgi:hypothetical protein